jgi:mannose-1-phosphate guanylyltransferase
MMQPLRDNGPDANRSEKLHLWAVLLAGGDGVRLRDLTRRIADDSRPKQFCRIISEQSLFRETRARLDPIITRDRQVFVFSRAHERYYSDDLTDAGDSCVIEQQLNRGTGVAIILALLRILQRDHDALAAFFPCDHFYADHDSFRLTIRSAVECAEHNPESIILVGADAEYPETDYGWIEPGVVVSNALAGPLSRVSRFWEKPSLQQAHALLRQGCLWNTFVTVGRATTFFEMLCSQVPEAVLTISRAMEDNTLDVAYASLDTVDFSRDFLAHLPHRLLVLRDRTSGWADLGSPSRVMDTLARNNIQPAWSRHLPNGSHLTADFSRCQLPKDGGAVDKISHSPLASKEHYSMTARSMLGPLNEAFVAGLLLAGSLDVAEAAVLDGIAALDPDAPCSDTLLEQTAKASIRRRAEFPERSKGVSTLPLELKRLLLLAPICRDCFILQVLIGLTPATCSRILHISQQERADALHAALQSLPFIETRDRKCTITA